MFIVERQREEKNRVESSHGHMERVREERGWGERERAGDVFGHMELDMSFHKQVG